MAEIILAAEHISKSFDEQVSIPVLKDINFSLTKGEFISVIGKSGCGKSTLLYILSTLDTDYEGILSIDGHSTRGLKEVDLARIRNEKIGFVFQFHYLLSEYNVLRNVMIPAIKLAKSSGDAVTNQTSSPALRCSFARSIVPCQIAGETNSL